MVSGLELSEMELKVDEQGREVLTPLDIVSLARTESDVSVLEEYCDSELGGIHRSLIDNPNISPALLHKVAQKCDWLIRREILSRPDISLETFTMLLDDPYFHVRQGAAINQKHDTFFKDGRWFLKEE